MKLSSCRTLKFFSVHYSIMSKQSGTVVRMYSLSDAGKAALPVVEKFEEDLTKVLRNYKKEMNEIADKYGIPEDKRNGFMASLLRNYAAELFGFSEEVSLYIQGLEKQLEKLG
ncbi:MAG: hypothetical protein A2Y81_06530 [Nitrospirae bacterium RBG_13_43_8]|nr:MAG: hypothetical protein A2Y81_06530 [Nitrospirae bacterium RBG_13_43_8]